MIPFCGCILSTSQLLLLSSYFSADSLDEIVGLDISYHGAQTLVDNTNNMRILEESSVSDQTRRQHREKRQQKREQNQKRTLRRRMLLLDLSSSKSDNGRASRGQETSENAIIGIEEGANEEVYR